MISFSTCKNIQKMLKCVEIKAFSKNLVQKKLKMGDCIYIGFLLK